MTEFNEKPFCSRHPKSEPKYIALTAGTGELRCKECNELIWTTKDGVVNKKKIKKGVNNQSFSKGFKKVPTKIKADDPSYIPVYQTDGSVCADLVANLPAPLALPYRTTEIVDCGFSMELPPGYKAVTCARSSLAKKGLIVTNAPGQIDTDYRGRVKVLVTNVGKEIITISHGDRFAQIALEPVYIFKWKEVEELSDSDRDEGGFGSTGVK